MPQNAIQLETLKGFPLPLGASEKTNGINFSIYAKDAAKLSLCLFEENNKEPFQEINLDPTKNKTGEVWHILVKGLPSSVIYGYRVTPATKPDTNYLLLDPYAKAVASDPHWSENTAEERNYRPLGKVIPTDTFDWQGDVSPNIPIKDLIIYEMHVRGFTRHPSSQVKSPGTFQGIIEKIPYLVDLGINAIELLPIHEFNEREVAQVNPATKQKLVNYFGYSTVNFFAPMNRYASHSEQDQAVIEFKTMVRELHKKGIEVILDVVYNHTFEGNENGPILSFKGLDNKSYYMLDKDGKYFNFSGTGNTVNSNNPIVIELILSSLRYWVAEMHVDGFRFDLASILTRLEDGTPLSHAPIVDAISRDPILSKTKLIAEAWDAAGLYQVGSFGPGTRWAEWNGKYRDIVRRFIKGTPTQKNIFATCICGSRDLYGGRAPYNSINFVTAHDGFSLADLVSYNDKHNEANGEENRDGFSYNDSWNCGIEGHTSNQKVVALRERQIRNLALALMVSQGVPMIVMSDEYAHMRHGNNNPWCQDNELNWFLWDQIENRPGFHRFFRGLIHFRRKQHLLRQDIFLDDKAITWHGCHPLKADWDNDNKLIAFTLNSTDKGPQLYVAFNASNIPHTMHIPPAGNGQSWYWVVNTSNPPPDDIYEDNQPGLLLPTVRMSAYSSIMLISK